MKKRLLAALCAAVLLFGLLLHAGATAKWDDGLMFLALNDNLFPISSDTMPISVGGVIYIPYNVFDHNQNGGIRLGLYNGSQSPSKVDGTPLYTIYSDSRNLNFDLSTGMSYSYYPDDPQEPRAVIRNGRIYLSASALCRYFKTDENQLTYYQTTTKYGYPLIRITNSNAQLSNQDFLNAASISAMLNVLNTYYHSLPSSQSTPSPSPSAPAAPSPSPSPDPGGHRDLATYLAVRCDTGAATAEMLDTLTAAGRTALLLFSPADLARQDDLIRRAMGEGHVVGLLSDAAAPEEALAELEQGNHLLSHIAYTETRIVLASGGAAVTDALTQAGWLCWETTVSAIPGDQGVSTTHANAVAALSARRDNARILMDDSAGAPRVLSRLLATIQTDQYDYRTPVETEF